MRALLILQAVPVYQPILQGFRDFVFAPIRILWRLPASLVVLV
ncbi:MAG: hypothetical protein QOI57_3402 [Rubrobacteraceae bacterium]|nr:hypothetical protein [Rubrobacteraceae bacterium]